MHARNISTFNAAMFLGFKLVYAFSFFAIGYSQSPDATTYYRNMIDNVYPSYLADYNAAIAAFPASNATPEDIDVSFVIFFYISMSL